MFITMRRAVVLGCLVGLMCGTAFGGKVTLFKADTVLQDKPELPVWTVLKEGASGALQVTGGTDQKTPIQVRKRSGTGLRRCTHALPLHRPAHLAEITIMFDWSIVAETGLKLKDDDEDDDDDDEGEEEEEQDEDDDLEPGTARAVAKVDILFRVQCDSLLVDVPGGSRVVSVTTVDDEGRITTNGKVPFNDVGILFLSCRYDFVASVTNLNTGECDLTIAGDDPELFAEADATVENWMAQENCDVK